MPFVAPVNAVSVLMASIVNDEPRNIENIADVEMRAMVASLLEKDVKKRVEAFNNSVVGLKPEKRID